MAHQDQHTTSALILQIAYPANFCEAVAGAQGHAATKSAALVLTTVDIDIASLCQQLLVDKPRQATLQILLHLTYHRNQTKHTAALAPSQQGTSLC